MVFEDASGRLSEVPRTSSATRFDMPSDTAEALHSCPVFEHLMRLIRRCLTLPIPCVLLHWKDALRNAYIPGHLERNGTTQYM